MFELLIQFAASDQSKWDRTLHEGEMAIWLALTYLHLVPGFGN